MRWLGKMKYASSKLDEVLSEWKDNSSVIKSVSYQFALRFLAPLDVKNDELAVAIGAAAYSIITEQWFNNEWHDKLNETCEEGYEAGFIVREIIEKYRKEFNVNLKFAA